MAKGISGTGKGFDLSGRRLGGFSHQPPLSSLRQTALAAAESRARRGALLPSGPQRLGGDINIKSVLSPIQSAAMAAERRLQDDLWCGSKSTDSDTYIQENLNSSGPSERQTMPSSSNVISIPTSATQSVMDKEIADGGEKWQCNTCTLLNEVQFVMCLIWKLVECTSYLWFLLHFIFIYVNVSNASASFPMKHGHS